MPKKENKIDEEILFRENYSIMLTIISGDLYEIADDGSQIWFHDDNCSKLFFIYLHDYISASTKHLNLSLFDLTLNFCERYNDNHYFKEIIEKGHSLKAFLSQERIYPKIYISPHEVDLKIRILDLLSFAGNEAKHSYFRLNRLIEKLEKIFSKNGVIIEDQKDYYEHLEYFMEWVVENKLNYHQTKIVELLGNYFLAIDRMLNSEDCRRVRKIRNDAFKNFKPRKQVNMVKPSDLSDIEKFYCKIMWVGGARESRLTDLIPETSPVLQLRD